MIYKKRLGFGFGTIFSLIVIYFIFLYSRDKGWAFLAFISKWYLIIIGGFIALTFIVILMIIIFSLLMLFIASIKMRSSNKNHKKQKSKEYIDVEYKVKD